RALAAEHPGRVLLPERPEPLLDLLPEDAVERGDPGLLDDQEARASLPEPLLDPVKEVEQYRDQGLLAEVHQMADLEDLEGARAEAVLCRVEEPAERAGEGVMGEAVAELVVLQRVDEVGERPRGAGTQELERPGECLPLTRGDPDTLQAA